MEGRNINFMTIRINIIDFNIYVFLCLLVKSISTNVLERFRNDLGHVVQYSNLTFRYAKTLVNGHTYELKWYAACASTSQRRNASLGMFVQNCAFDLCNKKFVVSKWNRESVIPCNGAE